mmetsp:Transcript_26227/g.55780  ORF Transcript_26227/g.55780 Transcript_26227/m.55780 type:complete len:217 (+) Transcript_26227:106-756(+)
MAGVAYSAAAILVGGPAAPSGIQGRRGRQRKRGWGGVEGPTRPTRVRLGARRRLLPHQPAFAEGKGALIVVRRRERRRGRQGPGGRPRDAGRELRPPRRLLRQRRGGDGVRAGIAGGVCHGRTTERYRVRSRELQGGHRDVRRTVPGTEHGDQGGGHVPQETVWSDRDLRRQGGLSGFFEAGDVDAPGRGRGEEPAPTGGDDARVVPGWARHERHR